jgi:2',3'-cyclic-nucleotide 2'-phosphodiesterase (5'-nucleotidase family)
VLGGLARRVSLVEKLKDEGEPVLAVDSGNLFTDMRAVVDHKQSLTRAQLIGRTYRHMGVAAINVGALDLVQGLAFLLNEASRGLPLISSNLVEPTGRKPIFQPYIIKKFGKTRFAFFGLLSPDINPAIQKTERKKFLVNDPTETARAVLDKLRGRADVIILLSALDPYREREVVKAVSGINFVLGGYEGWYIQLPVRERQTPIFESYRNGMYAGKLQLSIVNAASPFRDEGREDKIKRQIQELDLRLSAIKETRGNYHKRSMENAIENINKQKTSLQEELKSYGAFSPSDNRFFWTLVPLDNSFPEDKVISEWIRKEGFERD